MNGAAHRLLTSILLVSACVCRQIDAADTLEVAVNELAGKLRPHLAAAESWHLSVNMPFSQSSVQTSLLDSLTAALRTQGARLIEKAPAAGELAVTVSETPQGFLLVASLQRGEERWVAMVPLVRSALSGASLSSNVTLEKTLLWEQITPILDVAWSEDEMLILDPDRVAVCRRHEGHWELEHNALVTHAKPWPRDLRGRLRRDGGGFAVYMPGVTCHGGTKPQLNLSCEESGQEWPLQLGPSNSFRAQFESGRNFFSGAMTDPSSGKQQIGPFFSAAVVEDRGRAVWLVARLDGRVGIYEGIPKAAAQARQLADSGLKASQTDWGSDLVALKAPCTPKGLALATQPARGLGGETIQAFEIDNLRPWAASPPIEFSGSVVALWPASETTATAVIHHSTTGRYAAYGLTITCSR